VDGRLVPLTGDGLIYARSMVMLDSVRRKTPVPALTRWLLGLGIAATLCESTSLQELRAENPAGERLAGKTGGPAEGEDMPRASADYSAPAPGAAAARLPRCRSYGTGWESCCVSDLREDWSS
jgi:hypothetical protein